MLLFVFAGALTGLLAMHGLGHHGASSHDLNASRNAAVMAVPTHPGHTAGSEPTVTETRWSVSGAAPEDSPGMAMAIALCLAVLVGAVLGFGLLRPHKNAIRVRPHALTFMAMAPSARRDRDPPCLFELSVLRT